ncbi:GPP34 family phosphoprotein [Catenuloplanes atrovinosus]|uniref:GPP34 family phosphoprotein n=1 Tax=Catenuloplanes atrovinosus TaxID=137266 RepID=A0AAE3YR39_9ACTN|nr:GPP34 family phosphoprotein [Catenuloplanes atrovinosus]MDR7277702.1 hypothetical protein [Catenuloplanes atrovinosus]
MTHGYGRHAYAGPQHHSGAVRPTPGRASAAVDGPTVPVAVVTARQPAASTVRRKPGHRTVDDLFWAFHESRGVCRVSAATAELGLAAALLWDLREYIAIGSESITVVRRVEAAGLPEDALEAEILRYLIDEAQAGHSTLVWLEFIASCGVYRRTVDRLVTERKAVVRGTLRKRYEPANILLTWPALQLMRRCRADEPFTAEDIGLLALVMACGLQSHVFYDDTAHAVAHAQRVLETVPADLRALYLCTRAAIGKAVEVHR